MSDQTDSSAVCPFPTFSGGTSSTMGISEGGNTELTLKVLSAMANLDAKLTMINGTVRSISNTTAELRKQLEKREKTSRLCWGEFDKRLKKLENGREVSLLIWVL